MARFNEILQARYNRFLQRLLSMKGGPVAAQLGSEVGPTLQLDDANYLENRFQSGWRSYGTGNNAAAGGAGNRSCIQLANPVGTGIVAVIEKITYFTTATDTPNLTRGGTPGALTAGVGQGSRDGRISGVSACLLKTSVNAGAISGFLEWVGGVPAGNTQIDLITNPNQELTLMPGDNWTVWVGALNQAGTVSFFWRERALEEGEIPGV